MAATWGLRRSQVHPGSPGSAHRHASTSTCPGTTGAVLCPQSRRTSSLSGSALRSPASTTGCATGPASAPSATAVASARTCPQRTAEWCGAELSWVPTTRTGPPGASRSTHTAVRPSSASPPAGRRSPAAPRTAQRLRMAFAMSRPGASARRCHRPGRGEATTTAVIPRSAAIRSASVGVTSCSTQTSGRTSSSTASTGPARTRGAPKSHQRFHDISRTGSRRTIRFSMVDAVRTARGPEPSPARERREDPPRDLTGLVGQLIADDADHGPADLTELRIPGEVPGLLVPRAVARSVVLDGHPRIGGPEGKRGEADRGVGLDD